VVGAITRRSSSLYGEATSSCHDEQLPWCAGAVLVARSGATPWRDCRDVPAQCSWRAVLMACSARDAQWRDAVARCVSDGAQAHGTQARVGRCVGGARQRHQVRASPAGMAVGGMAWRTRMTRTISCQARM